MENYEKRNQQEDETGGYNVETYEPLNIKPEEARQNKECIIKAFTESSPSQNEYNMTYQNISNYSNYNNMNYQIYNSQYLYNDQNNINYSITYPLVQSGVENNNYSQDFNSTNNQNSYYYQDTNSSNYNYSTPITQKNYQDMNSSNYNYSTPINYYGNNYNISEYSYQYIPQTAYGYNNSNYYGTPYRQSFLITQNKIYPSNYKIGLNYTNVYI